MRLSERVAAALTPDDREAIAQAVRKGMAPTPPSWRRTLASTAFALVFAFLGLKLLSWLQTSRPPATVSMASGRVGGASRMTFAGSQGVDWLIDAAFAQNLRIAGPGRGILRVELPLPGSRCAAVGDALEGSCSGRSIATQAPVEVQWSGAMVLQTPEHVAGSSRLDATFGVPTERSPSVSLQAVGGTVPTLCLVALSNKAAFSINAPEQSFPAQPVRCGSGVTLVVGSATKGAEPPAVELGGVKSLVAHVTASSSEIDSVAGPLLVVPGGTHVLSPPALLQLRAARGRIESNFRLESGKPILHIDPVSAMDVTAGGDQLVPSRWARDTVAWQLVVGAVFSLLVLPRLGEVIQALMGARLPRRRLRGSKGL